MKNIGLMVNRVGSPNSQKQYHDGEQSAPVRRGIWAFPWPINDYFFSAHQADKFKKKTDEFVTVDLWKRLVTNELKTKKFIWTKPFYSRLAPRNFSRGHKWYLWEDHKEFSKTLEKSKGYWTHDPHLGSYFVHYSVDHLELFLPMTGNKLPYYV